MMRWLAFLLLAISPAAAFTPPSGQVMNVPDNATLTATATTAFPQGVYRDDFIAGRGAPPLWYMPSNSACSLAAGAGDNGSQVKSADNKCWLAQFPASGADLRQWGAIGDWNGTTGTDNTTAIQSAVNYGLAGGAKLIVGPGAYRLTAQVAGTFSADKLHLTFIGQGKDESSLVWTNASGGLKISYAGQFDSVDVRDLTFATNQNAGGTALTLTQTVGPSTALSPVNEIKNNSFRGTSGFYWTTGVQTNGINTVNFFGNTFTGTGGAGAGTGVDLEGTVSLNGAAYNFFGNSFTCLATGLQYGTYIQGVNVTGGNNFVCGTNGILVPPGGVATDQLTVVSNEFEVTYGIRDQTGVNGMVIANNLFITSSASSFGISLEANTISSIVGNECQSGSATSTCMQITAGSSLIANNKLINQHLGILLGASSTNNIVSDNNSFAGSTTSVTDNGTNNSINGDFIWTPVVKGATTAGTPTYGADGGVYHRDNKRISALFYVTLNALGGMTGNMQITGLPFNVSAQSGGNCSFSLHTGFTGNPQVAAYISPSANPVIANLADPSTGGLASTYTAPMSLLGQCDYTTN